MNGKREYGDYQTPLSFTKKVCEYLLNCRKVKPSIVLEPTCGLGNFLKSSLIFQADKYYGIEINPDYCEKCKENINNNNVTIINSDFFCFSSKNYIKEKNDVLIIGNPPWVTNSTLSVLGSNNLPNKKNFKALAGLDALTGESNFDICEFIILQIINEFRNSSALICMLCKTSVARNIFKEMKRSHISFESCDVLEFDATKVFGINASSCVLIIQLTDESVSPDFCNVFDFEEPEHLKSKFGYRDGKFYSNILEIPADFDGECCFTWRQGVKHDCSSIMELTLSNGLYYNGKNEPVSIEDDIVFPLIKSSMFKSPVIHSFERYVIVTQKKSREETQHLKLEVPKTWDYLFANKTYFDKRRSSIYIGSPPFSMYGVGDYSYSKYKVGVSGFYKKPLFSLLYSDDGKPVMTDDTSYFICFEDYDTAYIAMLLLNSESVQSFLTSIAFLDAKRPYTKKVLERIDFNKIVSAVSLDDLKKTESSLKLTEYITLSKYNAFKEKISIKQLKFA